MTNFIEKFYYGNIDPQAHSSHLIPSLRRRHPTQTIRKTSNKAQSGPAKTAGPDFSDALIEKS